MVKSSPLSYLDSDLCFDNLKIAEIIKNNPTPFYLYSEKSIKESYQHFSQAASILPQTTICYAMKANGQLEILKLLARAGSGADIVSGNELRRALEAGIPASKIVFSGVGKTKEEIDYALSQDIYSFNVESLEELEMINRLAKEKNQTARVSFRLNPKVMAKTHKHIATGDKIHKFGLLEQDILESLNQDIYYSHTKLVGLSIHIGSQLTELEATKKALKALCECALKIPHILEFLDVGGGLGINYEKDSATIDINEYMTLIQRELDPYYQKNPQLNIVFEPGRILIARAGCFVTSIIRNKKTEGVNFMIVDGGMNDFMRPSLYNAYHEIFPSIDLSEKISTDVVGPVCESTDIFAHERMLPLLKPGQFIAIADTGAYGFVLASNYNLRVKPCQILIQEDKSILRLSKEEYSQNL